MPLELKAVESDGSTRRVRLPEEILKREGMCTVRYNSEARIESVMVVPGHQQPDVSLANNVWVERSE